MTTNKKNADNLLIISTFYWYPEPGSNRHDITVIGV